MRLPSAIYEKIRKNFARLPTTFKLKIDESGRKHEKHEDLSLSTIKSLSVIIPAFNEKSALNDALDEVVNVLEYFGVIFEIIVINDGSNDGSADLLAHRSSADPRIKSISHEHNFGKGKALRTGLKNSSNYDWTLIIDADLQIPLTEFATFEANTPKADVIIGNRFNKQYTLYRRFISFVNRCLTQALFEIRVRDINCPFKLIKTDELRDIQLSINGFGIDAELLWQLSKNGATFIELPVESRPRQTGTSKVTPLMLVKCLLDLLYLKIKA
jgi:glycosyltransferase involved in cell wall biosynthesis